MSNIRWFTLPFRALTLDQLYEALKLRVDVFVVEQTCYYPELDDLDRHPDTLHLLAYEDESLIGYLRILPKGTSYENYASIGRVAIEKSARGKGIAHKMIEKAHLAITSEFPQCAVKISAQEYLTSFYEKHGYSTISDVYLEDGIPHIAMLRESDGK